jgi:hypothetical protein
MKKVFDTTTLTIQNTADPDNPSQNSNFTVGTDFNAFGTVSPGGVLVTGLVIPNVLAPPGGGFLVPYDDPGQTNWTLNFPNAPVGADQTLRVESVEDSPTSLEHPITVNGFGSPGPGLTPSLPLTPTGNLTTFTIDLIDGKAPQNTNPIPAEFSVMGSASTDNPHDLLYLFAVVLKPGLSLTCPGHPEKNLTAPPFLTVGTPVQQPTASNNHKWEIHFIIPHQARAKKHLLRVGIRGFAGAKAVYKTANLQLQT